MITLTPKEKAQELVNRFAPYVDTSHKGIFENAKQCALIAVRFAKGNVYAGKYNDYLDQVEQEINNFKKLY